jgi:hypothetical protein
MRMLSLLSLFALTSCATRPKASVSPLAPAAIESSVRFAEVIRGYQMGWYVDPQPK